MTPEQIAEIRERLRCKYYGEWSERVTDDIAALLDHIDAYAALTTEVLDAAIEACRRGRLCADASLFQGKRVLGTEDATAKMFIRNCEADVASFDAARAVLTRLKESL